MRDKYRGDQETWGTCRQYGEVHVAGRLTFRQKFVTECMKVYTNVGPSDGPLLDVGDVNHTV